MNSIDNNQKPKTHEKIYLFRGNQNYILQHFYAFDTNAKPMKETSNYKTNHINMYSNYEDALPVGIQASNIKYF